MTILSVSQAIDVIREINRDAKFKVLDTVICLYGGGYDGDPNSLDTMYFKLGVVNLDAGTIVQIEFANTNNMRFIDGDNITYSFPVTDTTVKLELCQ